MFNSYQATGMGYNPNQQQPPPPQQQQQLYSQPTAFGQPNLYGSNMQQGYIQTQPTGFAGAPTVIENNELKIPSIRLSFITAEDQKKFEHLFRSAVPRGEQSMSGDTASNILLRSGLTPVVLAEIWTLSDIDKTGALLFPEFALSLHLCNMAKRGEPLPGVLPQKWHNEVQSFIDAINFSIPDDPNKILANTPFAKKDDWLSNVGQPQSNWMAPQGTGYPQTSFLQNQATGFAQQPTGFGQQATGFGQQPTGFGQQSSWLAPQATGFNNTAPPPSTSFGGAGTGIGAGAGAGAGASAAPTGSFVPLQPQQTAGLIQKPTGLQPQSTGFMAPQRTGGLAPQATGLAPQATGLQAQRTGGFGVPQQATGYQQSFNTGGLQANKTGPLQPNHTGYNFQQQQQQQQATGLQRQPTGVLQQQPTGYLQQQPTGYLQSQPTGRPGEWGFVSMPTGGMPGLNSMQQVFQPNNTQTYQDLHKVMNDNSASNVTWAISKQEKQIYDKLFQAWDTGRNGYVDSNVALNVFTKSGLGRQDLEAIWTLADTDDVGKLNKNQFAVAMHLIYRRLNGLEIPLRLPPELIPPADKTLKDTMDSLKNSLKNGGAKQTRSKPMTKPDGSRFKNDDSDFGYVSSSRYKKKSEEEKQANARTSKDFGLSIDDMKKLIREKKILIDAMDVEDEDRQRTSDREVDALKSKIYELQRKLSGSSNNGGNSKEALLAKLERTGKRIPSLLQQLNQVNQEISEKSVELVKLQLKREDPSWDEAKVDVSGAGGKFDLKQKMAMLTGKGGSALADSKYRDAVEKSKSDLKNQSDMVKDIESGIRSLEDDCSAKLRTTAKNAVGYEKWENGFGVSKAVADFVKELNKLKADAQPEFARSADNSTTARSSSAYAQQAPPAASRTFSAQETNASPGAVTSTGTGGSTGGSASGSATYSTPEERAAYIKAEAAKRMASRLEKLGISRTKRAPKAAEKHDEIVSKPSPSREEPSRLSGEAAIANPVERAPSAEKTPVNTAHAESHAQTTSSNRAPEPKPEQVSVPVESQRENFIENKWDEEKQYRPSQTNNNDNNNIASTHQSQEHNVQKTEKNVESAPQAPTSSYSQQPPAFGGAFQSEANKATETEQAESKKEPETTPVVPPAPAAAPTEPTQPAQASQASQASNSTEPASASASEQPAVRRHENNPFFKNKFQPVDTQKISMQRNFQRGTSNDNSWSDSEEEDSEDEAPNRAGAAQLANLLFGSMSSQPTGNAAFAKSAAQEPPKDEKSIGAENTSGHESTMNAELSSSGNTAAGVSQVNETPAQSSYEEPSLQEQSSYESNAVPAAPSLPESVPPPAPAPEAPSLPQSVPPPPPIPSEYSAPPAPSLPRDVPPAPEAPSLPQSIPPPPPVPSEYSAPPAPEAPSLPQSIPPPPPAPPAPPAPSFPSSIPPPPPAPPLSSNDSSLASAAAPPAGGAPNIGALLGQITGGKSLKKVETKVSSGATVGRVL